MKVVLAGGSGQLGRLLARNFQLQGHEVVVLSRRPSVSPWRTVFWDGRTPGPWTSELEGADVMVNLAGRSVNCRYTRANRRAILDSRVESTRVLGQALAAGRRPPPVWLQMSTATLYSHRFDAPNDEATGEIGGSGPDAPESWGFSIEVAKAWELEVDAVEVPGVRKVKLRCAMVMSPERGGAFDVLLGLVRRGLGGPFGDGRQFVSWIHDADFIRAVEWLMASDLEGTVNLAAPSPLPNARFMKQLRQAWGISFGLPASRWMLEAGAALLRTETELVLKSRRVVPGRLLEAGFEFRFPVWALAAEDLCRRWREGIS